MYTRKVTIINRTGLHARPASLFVEEAKKFSSKVIIKNNTDNEGSSVNAKSIVHLLTLGAGIGNEVEISAIGEDETRAVDRLVELIQSGFDE